MIHKRRHHRGWKDRRDEMMRGRIYGIIGAIIFWEVIVFGLLITHFLQKGLV